MLTSIHGRRLGLSSTNGIVQAITSTGGGSSEFNMYAQMWGSEMVATASSSGATISNVGITVLSSGNSTLARTFTLASPVAGVYKEIHSRSSSTLVTFSLASSDDVFSSSAGDSTTLVFTGTVSGLKGARVILRGLSTTQWGIMSLAVPATA